MECPNCRTRGATRTHPNRKPGSIILLKTGEVRCDTGDCERLQCPACRAIFFQPLPGVPKRMPVSVGARLDHRQYAFKI